MMNDNSNTQLIVDMYNPLIMAAKPIITLANAMNQTTSGLSVEQVLYKFSNLLSDFEEQAEKNRASFETIKAGKYCLCAFIDEAAVRAGWANEEWSKGSLLFKTFDETWGGERFFEILDTAVQDSEKNIHLIELVYLCLEFGYRGKYHVVKDGDLELEKRKNELSKTIKNNRPNLFGTLFIQDKVEENNQQKSKITIPVWALAILCALLIAALYTMLQSLLGSKFGEVSSHVNNLSLPKIATYTQTNVKSKNTSTKLAPLLASMIEQKYITVNDFPDKSVITILGDGLYEPGSEVIKDEYYSVFASIGQELDNTKGKIVISGYTDNTPIRSIEYPSNWHLSQARADSVKKMLINTKDGYIKDESRVRSEGRGDTNPVAPNDSNENKAKNRRVEITLYHAGGPVVIKPNSSNIIQPVDSIQNK